MEKKKALVVDLDGTLCVLGERKRHVEGPGKKDWKAFFAGAVDDTLDTHCHNLVLHGIAEGHTIIFLTGRPSYLQRDTAAWILKHTGIVVQLNKDLFMRPDGDRRVDVVVKEEIYLNEIAPKYEVIEAYDDKPEIIKMWQNHGIQTIHFQHEKK